MKTMATENVIGKRITALRKSQKLTQAGLATRAGLDRSFLSEIENGHKNISVSTLKKIANALQITMSSLVEGLDDDPSI